VDELVAVLKDEEIREKFKRLPADRQAAFAWRAGWLTKAHKHQILPDGDWWSIWLLLAGRGAGKTRTAAEQIGWWAWEQPGTRWLVAAPTSADVRATCFEGDSGLIAVIPPILIADYNRAYHEIKLTNGSLIKGIPASEPERFRGPQFHGGWLDELAAWDYLQEAWDQIMFGVRLGKHTRILATTTPKPKDLIIDLIGRDGDDVQVTTASTYSNLDNLAPSFQKQILQYEGTKLGRQEIYAEIIDPEEGGIVSRDWFRLWPADKPIPKLDFVVQSYDCAFTEKAQNDPTAAITFGVFRQEDGPGSVLIIDCWQDRLQYPDLRPKVIDEYETVFGEGKDKKRVDLVLVEDKAAGISLIQDLQRAHIPVRAYNPGRADKVQRLSIVANIIRAGRVWVPESSVRKGYVRDWAEGMVSQVCSFPNTDHDDFCVAEGSMVLMANGDLKPIESVRVGDFVQTPNGARRVTAFHDNGVKEVWQVQADGRLLLATGNHEVFTDSGWMRVDSLRQAVHNLLIIDQEEICRSKRSRGWSLRSLSSMAVSTGAILKAQIRRIVGTLVGQGIGCTGMSGSSITGRFPMGCTFTTLMATPRTTTSAILSASLVMPIGTNIAQNIQGAGRARNSWSTWNISDPRPLSGTSQKKAERGIESTQSAVSPKYGASLGSFLNSALNAFGAARTWLARSLGRSSADQPVKTLSPSFASASLVQNTHTTRRVFDLTVEGEHCYFANGILVHNCDALSQALRYLRDAGFLNIDPEPDDGPDEDDYADAGMRKRENPYAS
jgi:predicted phage terminase large subunit-like protein